MKIIPLTLANLKGFVRNWKSVFILIVLPLIMISVIFMSFNPNGMAKINIGFVESTGDFDTGELEEVSNTFAEITEYKNIDFCTNQIKQYNEYACVEITGSENYLLEIYYDNTREPIIWEILERIKNVVDIVQKQQTKDIAEDFVDRAKSAENSAEDVRRDLNKADSQLDDYIDDTKDSIEDLERSQRDLSDIVEMMDSDIDEAEYEVNELEDDKNRYLSDLPQDNYYVNRLDTAMDERISKIRVKIDNYKSASSTGEAYIGEMDGYISGVEDAKRDMNDYKDDIKEAKRELDDFESELNFLSNLDPNLVANPVTIKNKPTYIPEVKIPDSFSEQEEYSREDVVRGVNLIGLQTIFPTILFLIVVFLSLLISSFICLNSINSKGSKRTALVRKIFLPEILAIYVSSLTIVALPILCVLLVGEYLFRLPILSNIVSSSVLIFFLMSSFILLGTTISYLIKKEGATLLIATFVLVFTIFISGFLLPIERMVPIVGFIAARLPTKLAIDAFNQTIFYNQPISAIWHYVVHLASYSVYLFVLVAVVKKIKERTE